MEISAIWLRLVGDEAEVLFEKDGQWRRAITENIGSKFSNIVELNITGNGVDAGKPRDPADFEVAP